MHRSSEHLQNQELCQDPERACEQPLAEAGVAVGRRAACCLPSELERKLVGCSPAALLPRGSYHPSGLGPMAPTTVSKWSTFRVLSTRLRCSHEAVSKNPLNANLRQTRAAFVVYIAAHPSISPSFALFFELLKNRRKWIWRKLISSETE